MVSTDLPKMPYSTGASASEGDSKQMVLNVIKQISATKKFVHKNDIFTILQDKMSHSTFEAAIKRLKDDAEIFPTHDDDHFAIVS